MFVFALKMYKEGLLGNFEQWAVTVAVRAFCKLHVSSLYLLKLTDSRCHPPQDTLWCCGSRDPGT